jgi:hypothetical protein
MLLASRQNFSAIQAHLHERNKPVHTLKMTRFLRFWRHSRAASNQKEDQQHRDRNSQEPEKDPPELSPLRCTFAEILHVLESP